MNTSNSTSFGGAAKPRNCFSNRHNDALSDYCCAHVDCAMAPEDVIYPRNSEKLGWLRRHELGAPHCSNRNELHAACLRQYCARCREIWGCNMAQYIAEGKSRSVLSKAYASFGFSGSQSNESASGRTSSPLAPANGGTTATPRSSRRRSLSSAASNENHGFDDLSRVSASSPSNVESGEAGGRAPSAVKLTTAADGSATLIVPATSHAALAMMFQHVGHLHVADRTVSGGRAYDELRTKMDAAVLILEDLTDFLEALPLTSPYRWSVVGSLARRVPVKTVADFTGMNERTIRNAKKRIEEEDEPPIACGRHPGEHRVHFRDDVLAAVREHWFDCAQQTHRRDEEDNRLDLWWAAIPYDHVYLSYRVWVVAKYLHDQQCQLEAAVSSSGARPPPRGATSAAATAKATTATFDALDSSEHEDEDDIYADLMRRKLAVGRTTFLLERPDEIQPDEMREHKCAVCRLGYEQVDKLDDIKKQTHESCERGAHAAADCDAWKSLECVRVISNDIERLQTHCKRVEVQSAAFAACKRGLVADEILMLMDFSPYSRAYRRERGMADAMSGTQCLHMCVYEGVAEGADPVLSYYDHFAQESNDYHFVRRVFLRLFNRSGPLHGKTLRYVWSDGGPKHFKTKRSLGFVLVELPWLFHWSVKPEWHFFISMHGKSLCDAHASNVKRIFKSAAKRGGKLLSAADYAAHLNSYAPMSEGDRRRLFRRPNQPSSMTAYDYQLFDRSDAYEWDKFDSVREHHRWVHTGRSHLVGDVRHYELLAYPLSDEESQPFTMTVTSKYQFDESRDGTELDLPFPPPKPKRMRRKMSATNSRPKSDSRDVEHFVDAVDDEIENDEDNVRWGVEYVIIEEAKLKEETDYKNYRRSGLRVAVRLVMDDGSAAAASSPPRWFPGSVIRWRTVKVLGTYNREDRDKYTHELLIVFDGSAEKNNGEWVPLDDDVRLVKK